MTRSACWGDSRSANDVGSGASLADEGEDGPLGPTAGLLDPTQIAYDGKRLLVVGNSGWAGIDKSGARTKGASVEAIPLTAGCETDLG